MINKSSLLNCTRTQVSALKDPIPSLGDLINQSSDPGALHGKNSYFGNPDHSLCFLLLVLNCYWGICLPCSQTATKGATPRQRKPLAEGSGHTSGLGGACKIGRVGGEDCRVGGCGGHGGNMTSGCPQSGLGNQRLPIPPLSLECAFRLQSWGWGMCGGGGWFSRAQP